MTNTVLAAIADPAVLTTLGSILGPTGAVYFTLKVRLNGAKENIEEIKTDVKEIKTLVSNHEARLQVQEASSSRKDDVQHKEIMDKLG